LDGVLLIVDHHGLCPHPEQLSPSYEELSDDLVAGLMARVEALELENAELKRRSGMNSSNFSTPPSKDSIAAKAQRQS
jgi:hypothetical protein